MVFYTGLGVFEGRWNKMVSHLQPRRVCVFGTGLHRIGKVESGGMPETLVLLGLSIGDETERTSLFRLSLIIREGKHVRAHLD